MIDINEYVWEGLYVLKDVYDHNPDAAVLRMYRDNVIDGDYTFEISINSLDQFFEDTRDYYDEEKELEVVVIFDPIITAYWKMCDEYEARQKIEPKKNKFRSDMFSALNAAFDLPDYSFGARSYEDTKHKSGCRIVLLMYCEFYSHFMVPGALAEAYDAFVHYTKLLQKELDGLKGKIVAFPTQGEKEAA